MTEKKDDNVSMTSEQWAKIEAAIEEGKKNSQRIEEYEAREKKYKEALTTVLTQRGTEDERKDALVSLYTATGIFTEDQAKEHVNKQFEESDEPDDDEDTQREIDRLLGKESEDVSDKKIQELETQLSSMQQEQMRDRLRATTKLVDQLVQQKYPEILQKELKELSEKSNRKYDKIGEETMSRMTEAASLDAKRAVGAFIKEHKALPTEAQLTKLVEEAIPGQAKLIRTVISDSSLMGVSEETVSGSVDDNPFRDFDPEKVTRRVSEEDIISGKVSPDQASRQDGAAMLDELVSLAAASHDEEGASKA